MNQPKRVYSAEPNLEVAGVTVLSFIDNLQGDTIKNIAKEQGFDNIDTDQWYALNDVFGLFNAIAERGGTQPFVAMGMKIAEQSEFPDEMIGHELSLVEILNGWQAHYEANHRGGELPPVETVKVTDQHYQLVLLPNHLYPYDLVYGMAYGFCKLLLPKGTDFLVKYDDTHNPYADEIEKVVVNVSWK